MAAAFLGYRYLRRRKGTGLLSAPVRNKGVLARGQNTIEGVAIGAELTASVQLVYATICHQLCHQSQL